MRKAIGKKLRFDVFKRDKFVCAYCGSSPPDVVLQVDHIHPVAEGGLNNIDNLITSCQPCNIGKGRRLLSDIPTSLQEKTKLSHQEESMINDFNEVLRRRSERIEEEIWTIAFILDPSAIDNGFNRSWLKSIERFIEKLGFYNVKEAADIAILKLRHGNKKTFLYFCGICHNKIKGQKWQE